MGQTLPNGIYLPAEGERNCYDGLEGNWRSLDGLISTVAGKASTSHTHGKADITDLFNSANTWTGTNTFSLSSLYQKGFSSRASAPASNEFGQFNIVDTNNNPVMSINYANRSTGSRDISLRVYDNAGNANGVGVFKDVSNNYSFCSINPSNTISLGTSDNKWKTLNGINPGALSLPDYNNVLDVTSEIPIASLDGNTQIKINDYLADKTGWLSIVIDDTAGNFISVTQGRAGGTTAFNNSRTFHTGAQSNGYISVFFPIIAGTSKNAFIKAASLIQMRFYYCLGNV